MIQARTFRITTTPEQIPLVEALLSAQGFAFEAEPFLAAARRLTAEPFPLGSSLAASFGLIYIQDRSSMLPPALLGQVLAAQSVSADGAGAVCLDMCASPGGKTGILALAVGRQGFVLAAEASRERLTTLRQNLRRMNAANTATAGAEAQHLSLPPESLDAILLDPPCSGWGTVDKNPRVLALWTPEKAETLVRLQRALLTRAAALLKVGGRLMYSTCTTHVRENEEQAAWALATLPLSLLPLPAPPGFAPRDPELPGLTGVLRVGGVVGKDVGKDGGKDSLDDRDGGVEGNAAGQGQGFFLACFIKKGSAESAAAAQKGSPGATGLATGALTEIRGRALSAKDIAAAGPVFAGNLPPGEARDFGGKVYFLHQHALALMSRCGADLRWQGLALGTVSGGRFRPDPRARMLMPPAETLPSSLRLDVDEPQPILDLLAGRSLELPGEGSLAGLYFRGLPLGLATRKGRRLLWSNR